MAEYRTFSNGTPFGNKVRQIFKKKRKIMRDKKAKNENNSNDKVGNNSTHESHRKNNSN